MFFVLAQFELLLFFNYFCFHHVYIQYKLVLILYNLDSLQLEESYY